MLKTKKLLSVLLAAVLICFTFFSNIPAKAAAAVPVVRMAAQPSAEYNVGDRVKVQFNCPSYPEKRVQYRAFLWQVGKGYAQEIYKDYAKDGYFYKPVCVGKSVFTIDVFYPQKPGTYYIVILAKPKGAKKYTSYVYTKTFTVKEKSPTVSVLDVEGKTYGSNDSEKPVIYDTDVKLTAKNITIKNASLSKDLYITGDNCTISNASVKGTIYINPGKNGSAYLNNVKSNNIKVLSGGQDSIHLLNVTASVLYVDNSSTESPVRIESDGTTTIDTTVVGSYSILDAKSGSFGTIVVKKNEKGKLVVEFRGTFNQPVTVTDGAVIKAAENSNIAKLIIAGVNKDDKFTLEGSFNTVEISKEANIELAEGTKINTFDANANTNLIADINTKIEILDKESNVVNITGEGAGSVIYQPVTPPSGGGGYVTIPVNSITVISTGGADAITTNNGTLQMIAAVMPAYATNKNVSWSVINGTGSASIDSSGLLKAITNGTVAVKAKAKDGSGVYGEKEITISGQTYAITKTDVIGGTAKVTVDKDTAATGETVTVEISEIETGKQFKSIAVTGMSGAVAVKEVVSGSEYTFTMPDEIVAVSVTLENIPVVMCPHLINGLSFSDDDTNDTNTIIKLGVPSETGNTFVYKISDDNNSVPVPNVGEDLSTWTAVSNGTSITADNGRHIGAAEVKNNMAVQFSDAAAVTEAEPLTYNISLSAADMIDLGKAAEDYTAQTPTEITVTKTGTGDITSLAAALSGTNADSFTITQPAAAALSDAAPSTIFTITPNAALSTGIYTADVNVTADIGITKSFTVNFTVIALPAQTGEPAITGGTTPRYGTQVTAGAGSLTITTNLIYTWYRSDDVNYDDGDTQLTEGTTYTPGADDIGKYLIVAARTKDAKGTGTAGTDKVVKAEVSASSNGIAAVTGTTTITLGETISDLTAGDIAVKVNETLLENSVNDKYTINGLGTANITISFLTGAALNKTSVVTVEIIKTGYVINGDNPIEVNNTIPVVVSAATLDYKNYNGTALIINVSGIDANSTFDFTKLTCKGWPLSNVYSQTDSMDPNSCSTNQYYYDINTQKLTIILSEADNNGILNNSVFFSIKYLSGGSGWPYVLG